jgi:hypothetical protein
MNRAVKTGGDPGRPADGRRDWRRVEELGGTAGQLDHVLALGGERLNRFYEKLKVSSSLEESSNRD